MTESTGTATGASAVNASAGYDVRTTGSTAGGSEVLGYSTIIELYSSQALVTGLAEGYPDLQASHVSVMTMGTQTAEFLDASSLAILTTTQIQSEFLHSSSLTALGSVASMANLEASSVAVLSLVRSNPERRKLRAWTFWQDGHAFYVLHLGDSGTLVFDTLTRKWSEWQTHLYNNWRANDGTNWLENVLAGSIDDNKLFEVSPAYGTDNFAPIVSVISGGFPMRMRGTIACDEVMVTSSVGMSGEAVATMSLRTSDDYGLSWIDWGSLDLSAATPRTQVTWQSLGEITAPGRIFEITDSGAAKRINSLELFSRDLKDG